MINPQKKHFVLDKTHTITLSTSIKTLEDTWNDVVSDNLYLSGEYLNALEKSLKGEIDFVYAIVYSGTEAIGKFYFQQLDLSHSLVQHKKITSAITSSKMFKILFNVNHTGILLCGNFFATGVNGFELKPNFPINRFDDILNKIETSLRTQKNKSNLLLIKEFWKEKDVVLQKKIALPFTSFEIDVNMVLELEPNWLNFDDYLQSMVTKYRTRAKNVYSKTKTIESRTLSLLEIQKYRNEIFELYNSVVDKIEFNVAKLSIDSFYHFKEQLKDKFIFTAYFKEDELVSFSTASINQKNIQANYVGINYQVNKTYPLYQRVLYDYVQLAIKNKAEQLQLGRTAEIIKSAVGAKPMEMILFIKHSNKILNFLFSPWLKYVKPSDYQIRKPFKKKL